MESHDVNPDEDQTGKHHANTLEKYLTRWWQPTNLRMQSSTNFAEEGNSRFRS